MSGTGEGGGRVGGGTRWEAEGLGREVERGAGLARKGTEAAGVLGLSV